MKKHLKEQTLLLIHQIRRLAKLPSVRQAVAQRVPSDAPHRNVTWHGLFRGQHRALVPFHLPTLLLPALEEYSHCTRQAWVTLFLTVENRK